MSTVSIRKTTGDDYAAIKAAVDQVIADIGGIEDIIKPGYKVIIKPNLVACPTDRLSGGVTRWEVCLAIYEAVKALGAEPVIAESSAAGADTELTIAKCGYQELHPRHRPEAEGERALHRRDRGRRGVQEDQHVGAGA